MFTNRLTVSKKEQCPGVIAVVVAEIGHVIDTAPVVKIMWQPKAFEFAQNLCYTKALVEDISLTVTERLYCV